MNQHPSSTLQYRNDDASSSPFGSPTNPSPFGTPQYGPYGTPGGPQRPQRNSFAIGLTIAILAITVFTIGVIVFVAARSASESQRDMTDRIDSQIETITSQAFDMFDSALDDVNQTLENAGVPANPAGGGVPAPAMPSLDASPGGQAAPDAPAAPATPAAAIGDLFSGARAGEVLNDVAAARGASDLRVLGVNIYPDYLFAQVQDPSNLEHVDEFQWRNGSVGEPLPVQLVGDGDLEANLFSADEVNWSAIPALVAEAPLAVSIEDGAVTHVHVARALPFSSDIRIRVFVSSPRDSGFIDADASGTMISINGN